MDDAFTDHHDVAAMIGATRAKGGVPVVLSHSPDPFPDLPTDIGLKVAGHTHCGQIRLPLVGALSYMSEHGDRYACGLIRERGQALVVSAGLGTSLLPLRSGRCPIYGSSGSSGDQQAKAAKCMKMSGKRTFRQGSSEASHCRSHAVFARGI